MSYTGSSIDAVVSISRCLVGVAHTRVTRPVCSNPPKPLILSVLLQSCSGAYRQCCEWWALLLGTSSRAGLRVFMSGVVALCPCCMKRSTFPGYKASCVTQAHFYNGQVVMLLHLYCYSIVFQCIIAHQTCFLGTRHSNKAPESADFSDFPCLGVCSVIVSSFPHMSH